jgi:hypothetical protein
VLDVDHKVHWGSKVSAYLVTKESRPAPRWRIPFVAFMPNASALGLQLGARRAGSALPARDERAARARSQATEAVPVDPAAANTGNWLVKGAWVLIGFGGVTTAILAARVLGLDALADGMRWTDLVGGSLAAAYGVPCSRNAKDAICGNDRVAAASARASALRRRRRRVCHAVRCRTAGCDRGRSLAVLHHALGLLERFGHDSQNQGMAAILLPTVPAFRGTDVGVPRGGMGTTTAASLLGMLLVHGGMAHPSLARCARGADLRWPVPLRAGLRARQVQLPATVLRRGTARSGIRPGLAVPAVPTIARPGIPPSSKSK